VILRGRIGDASTERTIERLRALAGTRLEAWRDRVGRGFAPDPPQAALLCDVAIAAAKQPSPSAELVEALVQIVKAR
jgi:hypothetical protein